MKFNENKPVTISDVARIAGVSAMTVSRALREPGRVSAKALEKITAVVERLGYVPDPAAQALAMKRTNVVGVIIPSITNSVFADVMTGIYAAAEGSGLQVQLGNSHYSPTDEERLIRTFLSQKPAGLIVAGIDQNAASRALLVSAQRPVVQIMEIGPDPVDMMVGFSHFDAARAATAHMIARGYRRPGFLAARLDPRTQRRLAGFRAEAEATGVIDEHRIFTTSQPSSVTLGGALMADLLDRAPDTDAVLCNNDDLALGALFECQRRNIAVPQAMGVCGFNDFEMMAAANPAITSVRTHRREMGSRSMQMLRAVLSGDTPPTNIVDLGFAVMERASTARS